MRVFYVVKLARMCLSMTCLRISESVLDEGALRKAVIFGDYPWNQAEIVDLRAVHCVDWKAVEIEIERIAND